MGVGIPQQGTQEKCPGIRIPKKVGYLRAFDVGKSILHAIMTIKYFAAMVVNFLHRMYLSSELQVTS